MNATPAKKQENVHRLESNFCCDAGSNVYSELKTSTPPPNAIDADRNCLFSRAFPPRNTTLAPRTHAVDDISTMSHPSALASIAMITTVSVREERKREKRSICLMVSFKRKLGPN